MPVDMLDTMNDRRIDENEVVEKFGVPRKRSATCWR